MSSQRIVTRCLPRSNRSERLEVRAAQADEQRAAVRVDAKLAEARTRPAMRLAFGKRPRIADEHPVAVHRRQLDAQLVGGERLALVEPQQRRDVAAVVVRDDSHASAPSATPAATRTIAFVASGHASW